MPNVDDHMDDLFRKAAENYPLKTTGNDWDAVQGILLDAANVDVVGKHSLFYKGRYFLLLLFVVAGSGLIYHFNSAPKNIVGVHELQNRVIPNDQEQTENIGKETGEIKERTAKENKLPGARANNNSVVSSGNITKTIVRSSTPTGNHAQIIPASSGYRKGFSQNAKTSSTLRNIESWFAETKAKYSVNIIPGEKTTIPTNEKNADTDRKDLNVFSAAPEKIIIKEDIADKPEDIATKTIDTPTKVSSDAKKHIANRKFYVGASIGFELNKIKQQEMTKLGFNAGVLAGWHLTHQLSLETGISITQKNYYSSGEFFHPKTGMMPAGMKVMSLNGQSTLFDIPLSVKYNFTKNKNGFYGIAGTSSYLLAKEQNEYNAMMSGQPMILNSTYSKNSFYPFSTINFGAGYQRSLGGSILRIEPYVQIPLRGIGIGSMPVTSTGLHLIITGN